MIVKRQPPRALGSDSLAARLDPSSEATPYAKNTGPSTMLDARDRFGYIVGMRFVFPAPADLDHATAVFGQPVDPIIASALTFATRAHEGQKRKYTDSDYVVHPIAVAKLVMTTPNWTMAQAVSALLHDVAEDTPKTLRDIEEAFGGLVASYVSWMTDRSRPEDGKNAVRKEIDRLVLSIAPAAVQTVKVADLIDNTGLITKHAPKFAKVYLPEKRLLLDVLKHADPSLRAQAYAQVNP